VPATTSWWDGPVAQVPVALRQRGERAQRGRAASAEDYAAQRDRLRAEAAEATQRQRAAAAELRAASSRLADVRLSPAATCLLLDLVARSLAAAAPEFASADGADEDLGVGITLTRSPGIHTVIRGADGDLALDGLTLTIATAELKGPIGTAHYTLRREAG